MGGVLGGRGTGGEGSGGWSEMMAYAGHCVVKPVQVLD